MLEPCFMKPPFYQERFQYIEYYLNSFTRTLVHKNQFLKMEGTLFGKLFVVMNIANIYAEKNCRTRFSITLEELTSTKLILDNPR